MNRRGAARFFGKCGIPSSPAAVAPHPICVPSHNRNARQAAGVRELDAFFSMTRSASRLVTLFFCGIAASLGLVGAELLPETELSTNCYNFPSDNFHKDNSVKHVYSKSPHLMLALGAPAVDFTLHDIDGNRWNLGEVLEAGKGKPVVLVFGMLTCPAYQGLDSGEDSPNKWTYWHERTLVSQLKRAKEERLKVSSRDTCFLFKSLCEPCLSCLRENIGRRSRQAGSGASRVARYQQCRSDR